MAASLAASVVVASDGPRIAGVPTGLASGEIEVEVDLGAAATAATLYLDGAEVCRPSLGSTTCRVDLGPALHVHLLELATPNGSGPALRAERWLNRPGHEADLEIELAARPIGNVCGGRLAWSDPLGSDPSELEARTAYSSFSVAPDSRTFGYPCPGEGDAEIVAAAAVFADGRRASAVALTNSNGRAAGPSPLPTVIESASTNDPACVDGWSGFEVAFVLDPTADFAELAGLGGSSGAAWGDATDTLYDADRLWFVRPDEALSRLDGFSGGRQSWLGTFFEIGVRRIEGDSRLADAVATAGLAVGGGPHPRAVALLLGEGAARDGSRHSVDQVRSYLAEIGVPLVVLRTAGGDADAWPDGLRVNTADELASALEEVRTTIDSQCVHWYPAQLEPRVEDSLPEGAVIAGRGAAAQGAEPVWRRAALEPEIVPVSEGPVARGKVEVTAVEVLVRALDAKGRPVTDLTASDLEVTEDRGAVPVLELTPLTSLAPASEAPPAAAPPAVPTAAPVRKIVPVAIYVERRLAGQADLQPAIDALADQAEWLTSLGPVDVVVAEDSVETVLAGARDSEVVRQTLLEIGARESRGHAIERIRTEYVRLILEYPERGLQREGETVNTTVRSSTPDNALRVKTMTVARTSIFEEDALLRRTMDRMNDWALGLQSSGPRLLFLAGTGFDEDPIDFYTRFLDMKDPSLGTAARAEFVRYNQATRVDSVGRELAAAGWMVVPVATRIAGSQRSTAEFSGRETFQAFLTDFRDGAYISDVDFMLLDPLGSQQHLAGPSGGEVVIGSKGLKKLIGESSGWYRLTYQVARPPDGALHEVGVTSLRPDIRVENTGVVVSGTSEGRAAMRLRTLLDDPGATGELPVTTSVGRAREVEGQLFESSLTARVNLDPIAPLFTAEGIRALRFSIAVRSGSHAPFVHHEVVSAAGAVDGMAFEAPIQWTGEDAELAVVVEDLASGAWGGTVSKLGG